VCVLSHALIGPYTRAARVSGPGSWLSHVPQIAPPGPHHPVHDVMWHSVHGCRCAAVHAAERARSPAAFRRRLSPARGARAPAKPGARRAALLFSWRAAPIPKPRARAQVYSDDVIERVAELVRFQLQANVLALHDVRLAAAYRPGLRAQQGAQQERRPRARAPAWRAPGRALSLSAACRGRHAASREPPLPLLEARVCRTESCGSWSLLGRSSFRFRPLPASAFLLFPMPRSARAPGAA
jgi:hypothetical protein